MVPSLWNLFLHFVELIVVISGRDGLKPPPQLPLPLVLYSDFWILNNSVAYCSHHCPLPDPGDMYGMLLLKWCVFTDKLTCANKTGMKILSLVPRTLKVKNEDSSVNKQTQCEETYRTL